MDLKNKFVEYSYRYIDENECLTVSVKHQFGLVGVPNLLIHYDQENKMWIVQLDVKENKIIAQIEEHEGVSSAY